MPNETDWIMLKKTINCYKNDISETWGFINQENATIVAAHKCRGKDLSEFLLSNDHFFDANTVASSIELFNESNIQSIYDKHHTKYCEILKLLCTDKMILLYEEYHNKVHNENAGLTSDCINT